MKKRNRKFSVVFLDTAHALALASEADRYHEEALQLAEQAKRDGTRIVTTRAVLLEIGNALSRMRHRATAVALLEAIERDPVFEIVPLTEELYQRAFELYCSRTDKEWGLVDCISCIVMQDYEIKAALTADSHFRQMGFEVLLGEIE
jgi:uncharacterized protein